MYGPPIKLDKAVPLLACFRVVLGFKLVAITNEMQLSKGIYYSTVH